MELNDLLSLVVGVLATAAGFLWKNKHKFLSAEQLSTLYALARTAVQAAETAGNDQGLPGQDKYALASDGLKDLAARLDVKLTNEEVAVLVHSVLGEMREAQTFEYESGVQ